MRDIETNAEKREVYNSVESTGPYSFKDKYPGKKRFLGVYRTKKLKRAKIELSKQGREGLFGVNQLSPEQKAMYDEIQAEGNETNPGLVRDNFPNKEKCMMKFGTVKRKSAKSKKPKRKCACKKN